MHFYGNVHSGENGLETSCYWYIIVNRICYIVSAGTNNYVPAGCTCSKYCAMHVISNNYYQIEVRNLEMTSSSSFPFLILKFFFFFCCDSIEYQIMENLKTLTNLQELWLGRNRIKAIKLCGLKCIKKISLQRGVVTLQKSLKE